LLARHLARIAGNTSLAIDEEAAAHVLTRIARSWRARRREKIRCGT